MGDRCRKKFIADVMVGRLARYLRMAGYDVIYINDAGDDLILEIAYKDGRVVLTRDTMMLKRREFKNGIIGSVFITSDSLAKQLLQVKSAMDLRLEPDLIICLECNNPLTEVRKEDIEESIPPYVYKTQDKFKYCSKCGRHYWRGTHYYYIEKYFRNLSIDNQY